MKQTGNNTTLSEILFICIQDTKIGEILLDQSFIIFWFGKQEVAN